MSNRMLLAALLSLSLRAMSLADESAAAPPPAPVAAESQIEGAASAASAELREKRA